MKTRYIFNLIAVALFFLVIVGMYWHWSGALLVVLSVILVVTRVIFHVSNENQRKASYEATNEAYRPIELLRRDALLERREALLTEFYRLVSNHAEQWPDDYSGRMKLFRSLYAQAMLD